MMRPAWVLLCFQDAEKGGVWFGGVCCHTKPAKTVNGLEGGVASPVFLGPMSAVIAAGKKPPEPPKPSKPPKPPNATHPLDHTPRFSAFRCLPLFNGCFGVWEHHLSFWTMRSFSVQQMPRQKADKCRERAIVL